MNSVKKTKGTGNEHAEQLPRDGKEGNTRAIAGGIAHDLNTILTVIYGYCELALESSGEQSGSGNNIRRIIGATDRARMLTEELIDLSRDLVEQREVIKVGGIITDTLRLFRPSLKDTIVVNENIKTPDICVEVVPAQLFRVIMNLASNAFQSMEDTGGSLTVTLDSSGVNGNKASRGNEHALIRFEDTGKGMYEEVVSKALDPFFTSGKGSRGTGLGLAVVSRIIDEMGGTLNISSRPGKGTIIDVLIPSVPFGPVT